MGSEMTSWGKMHQKGKYEQVSSVVDDIAEGLGDMAGDKGRRQGV